MMRCYSILALIPLALMADVKPRTVPPDPLSAVEIQSRLDQAKNDYQEGLRLADGDGSANKWAEAAPLFRKAAEAGYAPAQYEIARMYEEGLGVDLNLKLAAFWYRKAADQGAAEAQNNLGSLYARGRGVHKSQSQAAHWYGLAAAQNDPEATSNLGIMYLRGRGVRRDPVQAFQLFLRAAHMGYPAAQNNVALMYANGEGVGRDFVWAYAWLELASRKISGAERLRDEVGKQMTAGEIERAETLATRKAEEIAKKEQQDQ